MPNWCENRMAVSGTAENVRKFVETARNGEEALSFGKFVPEDYNDPDFQDGLVAHCKPTEPNPNFNWYGWRCARWGVKWDCSDSTVEVSPDGCHATFTFTTAWSAPTEFYRKVAELLPELAFECYAYEGANDYWYHFEAEGGEISFDETRQVWGGRSEQAIAERLTDMGIDPNTIDLAELRGYLSMDIAYDDYDISEYPEAEFNIFDADDEIAGYCEQCRI